MSSDSPSGESEEYLTAEESHWSEDGEDASSVSGEAKAIVPRAYQLELFQASMQQNIIVAMDTGSGKTQVAVLRIRAELERTPLEKRVWFLTPTVPLCAQQHRVISSQIPVANAIVLTGEDNVDSWSDTETWDAVLTNVRVVVCTYAILMDALSHGFVNMDSISLIVLDEAHNCTGNHPGRFIMTRFYMPRKLARQPVPHILGLTASPVMRSNVSGMEDLERSLDAVCRGATLHRDELLSHVNQPAMLLAEYTAFPITSVAQFSRNMVLLNLAVEGLNIAEDPYVIHLRSQRTEKAQRQLRKTIETNNTFTQVQVRSLNRRSLTLFRELGQWAVDKFIYQVVEGVKDLQKSRTAASDWGDREQDYIFGIIGGIDALPPSTAFPTPDSMSEKLKALVRILLEYQGSPVGIIFVRERVTANVLSWVLSAIPEVQQRYKIDCMVGRSTHVSRKQEIYEMIEKNQSSNALERFSSGQINLLIGTSVLEEGIDIPACNVVICFDRPANLKSFIQRRGRARMRASSLYLLLEQGEPNALQEWQMLELEMKQRYEDEKRELVHLEQLDAEIDADIPPLFSKTTDARLTIDQAKSHLDHFCRVVVGGRKYVDPSPEYLISTSSTVMVQGNLAEMLSATVILPACLPPSLREVRSSREWLSEANAKKDAAFEAYKMLYDAGLINEHLLPVKQSDFFDRKIDGRPNLMEVREQWSPWLSIAEAWDVASPTGPEIHRRRLRLTDHKGFLISELDALLPVNFPPLEFTEVYWSQHSEFPWTITFGPEEPSSSWIDAKSVSMAEAALEQTQLLLQLSFGDRFEVSDQSRALRFIWPNKRLDSEMIGGRPISREFCEMHGDDYLLRDRGKKPYFFQSWLPEKPPPERVRKCWTGRPGEEDPPVDAPWLSVRSLPKKCGFETGGIKKTSQQPDKSPSQPGAGKQVYYHYIIPEQGCTIDTVPTTLVYFSMLIPSIMWALEPFFVAEELLRSSGLRSLGFKDITLVATAITTSSASSVKNYQRLEFLGDAILKMITSITCAANEPHYPEGYLTLLKDRIVSNARLCKAAVALGLDRFIITKSHSLKRWRKKLSRSGTSGDLRNMSTKTLADVAEALVGAAFVDGGVPSALGCVSQLLPHVEWKSLEEGHRIIKESAPDDLPLPTTLEPLEKLLGYSFQKKSILIEAVTHASYLVPGSTGSCLERLEFMGDSIIDMIVVSRLFAVKDGGPIPHFDMHLLRTAFVNGDFQAFLAMEWQAPPMKRSIPVQEANGGGVKRRQVDAPGLRLVEFLRHQGTGSWDRDQRLVSKRHAELAPDITEALLRGERYPWDLLARLQMPKVYSDVFEAIIGAVWVDSGSLEQCEHILERSGMLRHMERAIRDKVKILHPKEELGRLAVEEKVDYNVTTVECDNEVEYCCSVTVGNRRVASVSKGVSKEEARVKAAKEAVRLWNEAGGSWDGVGELLDNEMDM